jgi:hypothetical protein
LSLKATHIPIASRCAFLARRVGGVFCCLCMVLLSAWAVLAIFVDCRAPRLHLVAAIVYLVAVVAGMVFFKRPFTRLLASMFCFAIVLAWWLRIPPSNEGNWQADVSRIAYADIEGTHLTFHNIRSCDYRAELDYACEWLTRTVDLDQVRGVDLFMNYWGSPWIAHTIVSFDLRPDPAHPDLKDDPIAFSIEARKHVGQQYSSVLGFFRQFTLISVVSNERDLVRLRTNYRHGEDLYLYHTKATPQFARDLLLNYAAFTDQLHDHPTWYNALTRNCTTEIFELQTLKGRPYDWRILLNGKADEMLYDQDALAAQPVGQPPSAPRLPFMELKNRAYINPAALAADKDPHFSEHIRENRPGFPGSMSEQ